MGYRQIDTADLDQWDDRPVDVRSISAAADLDEHDPPLGMRLYLVEPGEQPPLMYHYHDEQVEVFYVIEGTLHVETPEETYEVGADEVFVAEPGSPHRAFNPADAAETVRVIAIGSPSVDDGHEYEPGA